jgi:hypothetical protein
MKIKRTNLIFAVPIPINNMQPKSIHNKGQGKLFDQGYLESLTKTHPLVIYSIYLPVIIFMLYYGNSYMGLTIIQEILFFIGGVFTWTLFEYFIHRFLFHFIAHSKVSKRVVYAIHGVHHEYPRDKDRLFMPPVPSLFIAITLFSIFFLILKYAAFAFFPGFLSGYLLYGSMHYAIHACAPPRALKALWRNHPLHQDKSDDKGFGVSSILWDVVFGTVHHKE